ncbi:hypothetical protein BZL68_28180 [Escherichia coli]|nr:hypothetical protein BZL68_28180 [Escherichia coli]
MKVTRTDLHRCYSPISFTVIRTNCPLTDFGGKTSIFSHPVYLFLREFSLQDFRGASLSY